MCRAGTGWESRWVFSELAERPAQENPSARKTIFGDAGVLRHDAVIPATEMPPRARLSPKIRADRLAAAGDCWWARESSRRWRPDSAREGPRMVHQGWLSCAAQGLRWRLAGWAIRPVFSDLAARPAQVNSQASETIFCVERALPRENVPAKLAQVATRPNRPWRGVPERLLRRKSNSRFQSEYDPRVQGTAGQPLSSIH